MPETATAVANYFITKSIESGTDLTPMKVLKLVYIAHGFYLAATKGKEPLISETIEAWKYGPVISSLYHKLKHLGNGQIQEPISIYHMVGTAIRKVVPMPKEELFPFLDQVWDAFKGFTGGQLSTLTHQEGTAWDVVWNKRGGMSQKSALIPNDLIAQRFAESVV